ncbi:hypothetical protein GH733_011694 [Mirounga leonina]|nr:hypothetical protein GH733_011694 [Mirounga leonina]
MLWIVQPVASGIGSLSLTGPSSVTGTLGGSLSVPCQYEEGYQRHNKYWCRGEFGITCEKIVETKGEEKEERNGRKKFSHSGSEADGSCLWVLSSPPSQWSPKKTTERIICQAVPAAFPGLKSKQNLSTKEVLTYCSGSLLSRVHFLLLVFLKLPLFLTLVGAVLWVNRPQRGCGGNKPNEDNPQWYTVPRNGLSRNVALQTGQERPSDSGLQGRGAAVPGFWTDPGLFEGIVPVS